MCLSIRQTEGLGLVSGSREGVEIINCDLNITRGHSEPPRIYSSNAPFRKNTLKKGEADNLQAHTHTHTHSTSAQLINTADLNTAIHTRCVTVFLG